MNKFQQNYYYQRKRPSEQPINPASPIIHHQQSDLTIVPPQINHYPSDQVLALENELNGIAQEHDQSSHQAKVLMIDFLDAHSLNTSKLDNNQQRDTEFKSKAEQEEDRQEAASKEVNQEDMKSTPLIIMLHGKKYLVSKNSCFVLSFHNKMRIALLWLVTWKFFDAFILLCILSNSLCLALYNYEDRDDTTRWNQYIGYIGYGFSMLFLLEAILKILAFGFIFHQGAYLRDLWNIIDFVIVISGTLEFIGQFFNVGKKINLKSLRNLRVLRPLKSINSIPSMKKLVVALIDSVPQLMNVALFLLFVFMLFAIFGLQQYTGYTYHRCRTTPKPINSTYWPRDESQTRLCSLSTYGTYHCLPSTYCGDISLYQITPDQDQAYSNLNIQYDLANFDNLFQAFLAVFQIVTRDSWSVILFNLMDSNTSFLAALYCCLIQIVGSFILMNLILAVIIDSFNEMNKREDIDIAERLSSETIKTEEKQKKNKVSAFSEPQLNEEKEVLPLEQLQQDVNSPQISHNQKEKMYSLLRKQGSLGLDDEVLKKLGDEDLDFIGNGSNLEGRARDSRRVNILEEPTVQNFISQKRGGNGLNQESQNQEVNQSALSISNHIKNRIMKKQMLTTIHLQVKEKIISRKKLDQLQQEEKETKRKEKQLERAKRNGLFKFCYQLITSSFFQVLMVLVILANTVVLALDHYRIEKEYKFYLDTVNSICYCFFLLELVFKLIGLGLTAYFRDIQNVFDLCLVVIGSTDFILSYLRVKNYKQYKAILTFRTVRLFRVFKLAQAWPTLHYQLIALAKIVKVISTYIILLFLFMFIFALLGMEWFSYKVRFNGENQLDLNTTDPYPNSNFNHFYNALLTVFVVLTGDSWANIFYQNYRAVGGIYSSVYFLLLVIVGQYIILMLFIAILVDSYEQSSREVELLDDEIAYEKKHIPKILKKLKLKLCCCCSKKVEFEVPKAEEVSEFGQEKAEENSSLYIFSSTMKCRIFLIRVVSASWFDYAILFLILVSSVQLTLENPLYDPKGKLINTLYFVDIGITSCFVLESLLKITAFGLLFNGKKSYLRSGWNVLDLLIIMFSVQLSFNIQIISLNLPGVKLTLFKVLRLLRILRPLRLITKNEGLKVIIVSQQFQISIQALLNGIPQLINTILISIFFLFVLSILGVSFFKGLNYSCSIAHLSSVTYPIDLQLQIYSKWECHSNGGEWMRSDANFDDVLNAMIVQFLVSQTINWSAFMYSAMGFRGENLQPITFSSPQNAIYFVGTIIITNFLLTNLFVGVVVNTYDREKTNLENKSGVVLTSQQKQWLETKLLILNSRPKFYVREPSQAFRKRVFRIVTHRYFERFIIVSIFLNSSLLGVSWFQQPTLVTLITNILEYLFIGIFVFEAVLKIIGLSKRYFHDYWNIFDFILVLGSLAGVFVSIFLGITSFQPTTILRAFRIARLFKLVKAMKSFYIIFETFIMVLPSLANVGGLLMLLLYMFAVLGINLFATLQKEGSIQDNQNFQTIYTSILTLIIMSTGESFDTIMYDLGRQKQVNNYCIPNPSYQDYVSNNYQTVGCGSKYSSVIFCFSFIILIMLIFLNLFIAIIVDGYNKASQRNQKMFNSEMRNKFRQAWSLFDQDATTFMLIENFPEFMLALGEPLGWNQNYKDNEKEQKKFIAEIDLNVHKQGTCYQFMEVFESLVLVYVVQLEIERILRIEGERHNVMKRRREIEKELKDLENNKEIELGKTIQRRKEMLRKKHIIASSQENNQIDKSRNTHHHKATIQSDRVEEFKGENEHKSVIHSKRNKKMFEQLYSIEDIDQNLKGNESQIQLKTKLQKELPETVGTLGVAQKMEVVPADYSRSNRSIGVQLKQEYQRGRKESSQRRENYDDSRQ